MKLIVVFISILASAILTYGAYLFAPNFVHITDLVLDRIFDVRFGYWSLQHLVFAVVVGTIPIIALIPWLVRGHNRVGSLIVFNLITGGLITLLILSIVVLFIAIAPRGMFNTLKQPSEHFWNYVLVACSFCSASALTLFSLKTAKRYKLKRQMNASEDQIDQ